MKYGLLRELVEVPFKVPLRLGADCRVDVMQPPRWAIKKP
jgi:hypothetical protein